MNIEALHTPSARSAVGHAHDPDCRARQFRANGQAGGCNEFQEMWFLRAAGRVVHESRASGSPMGSFRSGAASPGQLGPRLRCDCAVTSAVRGGNSVHRGILTVLKTQLLRPNWTGLNWRSAGSTPVSATNSSITYGQCAYACSPNFEVSVAFALEDRLLRVLDCGEDVLGDLV